jgi:N-acyl amino acid synthase of PEP-CTERM/exosortase system
MKMIMLFGLRLRLRITPWFAIMEKKLWRALNRFGFKFEQIGEEVDYYGPVLPYLANIQDIEQNVYQVNRKLFYFFLEGLEPYYWPEFLGSIEHISK